MIEFSTEVYKEFNGDLASLDDDALLEHFCSHRHERRLYAWPLATRELLSMRWLRGKGLEIGAGRHPMRLFGDAELEQADLDANLVFGGQGGLSVLGSIDDPNFVIGLAAKFDFCIASHVLEHCDSFLRGLENLIRLIKPGGIAYIVLPDIQFLDDVRWMPRYSFEHHLAEYSAPLRFSSAHDRLYTKSLNGDVRDSKHARLGDEYAEMIRRGEISQEFRFVSHKHNYSFEDWIEVISRARAFLDVSFGIGDARFGYERRDCHFILEKSTT